MEHTELTQLIKDSVSEAVQQKVNGKIDKIHQMLEHQNDTMNLFQKKMDTHIAKVEPYIEGIEGSKRVGKIAMYIGGLIITIGGAYEVIKGIFK
jgi:hypothetical protein